MGLHALRNIGFKFKEQTAMCRKWQEKFTGFDPSQAVKILKLAVNDDTVEVIYFDCRYRLRCSDGVLEKQNGTDWTDDLFMNEALVIYHLLGDVKDYPVVTGQWCPEDTLDPVRIRSGNRMDPLFRQFAEQVSKDKEGFCRKAVSIGGQQISQGDCGYEFRPFDFMPVRVVFWEADEEFPAQLKVYVDTHVTDYLAYEAVDFVIADLMKQLQPDEKTAS